MFKKISSFVLALIIIMSSVFANHFNVFAQSDSRDISSTHVTGLITNKVDLYDGEHFNVTLQFDDSAGHIKSGDIIKVDWPSSGDVYFNGFKKTVPLMIHGKYVGDAVITPENATIVFNDKIENLSDVKGWVTFEMMGRNVTNTQSEDTKVGTIVSGTAQLPLKVTKGESGSSSVFYYKTGDMLPNETDHVRW